jgi:dihydrofolate reductase
MRKLILKMSMTVDGFVSGPHGELDWLFKSTHEDSSAWTVDIIKEASVHIMGYRTFMDMKAYWPTSTEIFAKPMNEIPKIAFSRKANDQRKHEATGGLKDAQKFNASLPKVKATSNWDSTPVLTGDLAEEIKKLKQQEGKDIIAHGGASFAQSLIATGLVDEYTLLTHPVVIGKGLPIFSQLNEAIDLKLINTKVFKTGTIARIYRPS